MKTNTDLLTIYNNGINVSELFRIYNSGIQTKNDSLTIKFSATEVMAVIKTFKECSKNEIEIKLKVKDSAGWNIQKAIKDIRENKGVFTKIGSGSVCKNINLQIMIINTLKKR